MELEPCMQCQSLATEVERLRLEVEKHQNRHSNGVIERITIGRRVFYAEDRSTAEIRHELNAKLIAKQCELVKAKRRIADLERELAEARQALTEERTRGLCDAVELIRKRAQKSGYSAHVTLHEMADEIREQYFHPGTPRGEGEE